MKTAYSFEFDHGDEYIDALNQGFKDHYELTQLLEELYFDIRSDIDNEAELFE